MLACDLAFALASELCVSEHTHTNIDTYGDTYAERYTHTSQMYVCYSRSGFKQNKLFSLSVSLDIPILAEILPLHGVNFPLSCDALT